MPYATKTAKYGTHESKSNLPPPPELPEGNPPGWRSPWRGAAVGGTLGGLLATALGYLYGHRGKWLAYDAIAGGLTGGAGGYAVDAHNNSNLGEKQVQELAASPHSREGASVRENNEKADFLKNWKAARQEKQQIEREGGYKANGILSWLSNLRKQNSINSIGADIDDPEEAWKNVSRKRWIGKRFAAVSPKLYWPLRMLGLSTHSYESPKD